MGRFQTVPFNIAGPTYQSISRPLASERTVNFWHHFSEGGKDQLVLHSFPGQKSLNNTITGVDRGTHQMNEVLFRVISSTLYEVDSLSNHTALGTVTGSARCIFADDGDNLVIISDRIWVYTKSTSTFQENFNVNLKNIISVTFINSTFIYTSEDLSYISLPNDPFDVSGLDAIAAESNPDKMVRDYAFNQTIYRMGKRTVELWWHSGVGNPPIARIDGRQIGVGLGARHSVASTDNALYWLGDDKAIYRILNGVNERISDDSISNTLTKMDRIDDAIAYTFTLLGLDFYLITFPSENRTFINNELLGKNGWDELSSGTNGDAYSATSLTQVYGKNLIAKGGQLLELSLDEYTQDSDTIIRERITKEINSDILGVKGKDIMMGSITFIMEQGIGLASGQGSDPRMRVEVSTDGARSFKHVDWVRLGRAGEHTLEVKADHLEVAKGFIFRLTVSDPVPISIYTAAIEVKLVGK